MDGDTPGGGDATSHLEAHGERERDGVCAALEGAGLATADLAADLAGEGYLRVEGSLGLEVQLGLEGLQAMAVDVEGIPTVRGGAHAEAKWDTKVDEAVNISKAVHISEVTPGAHCSMVAMPTTLTIFYPLTKTCAAARQVRRRRP